MLDYFYMNTDSHLALMAEPLNNVPMVPGATPPQYENVSILGWVWLGIVVVVVVFSLLAVISMIRRGYIATTGGVSLLFSGVMLVLVNIIPRTFSGTVLMNPVRDISQVISNTIIPVMFVVGLVLMFYGLYRLEKRVRTMM